MKTLHRWIISLPFAPLATLTLQGLAPSAWAFTDSNAELKEAAADRAARAVIAARAGPKAPMQAVWVPTAAKRLDGFKPVWPPERATDHEARARAAALSRPGTGPQKLASAER